MLAQQQQKAADNMLIQLFCAFSSLVAQGSGDAADHGVTRSSASQDCDLRRGREGGEHGADRRQVNVPHPDPGGDAVWNLRAILCRNGQRCAQHVRDRGRAWV